MSSDIFEHRRHDIKEIDTNRETVLYYVRLGVELSKLSKQYREDPDIVLESVIHNLWWNLDLLDDRINDREFIMKCVRLNRTNFFMNHLLRADPEIALSAMATNPSAFKNTHITLRKNKEFVDALTIDKSLFVDDSLKGDKDILKMMKM